MIKTTWNVPLYDQPDLKTCWRACLRMMLAWKEHRPISQAEWDNRCRSLFELPYGSSRPSLHDFQINQVAQQGLGLKGHEHNTLDDLKTHLEMGPVMFYFQGRPFGHMVVAVGGLFEPVLESRAHPTFALQRELIEVADPCACGYPLGPCRAGVHHVPASEVELSIRNAYIWYWN